MKKRIILFVCALVAAALLASVVGVGVPDGKGKPSFVGVGRSLMSYQSTGGSGPVY